jgi:hypothetical protein
LNGLLLPVAAQLGAEVRTRLRSAGTLFALAFILVGSTLWMPDPRGKSASITWRTAEGLVCTPAYTARYVSVATAILTTVFLSLVAFYLVAGSVRRDRETGVGAILAGTPLGKGTYLFGKLAANAAYLGLLSLLILAVGLGKQLALGSGPLEPGRFLAVWLFVAVPGTLFVAAMALLFDVTPVLEGRAGLVIWFFVSMFLLIALPIGFREADGTRLPFFDPAGLATVSALIDRSLPAGIHGVSMGLIFQDVPLTRVPWNGIEFPASAIAARLAAPLWAALPFLVALPFFDRFDPARGRPRASRRGARKETSVPAAALAPEIAIGGSPAGAFRLSALAPASARPGAVAALLADARLLWDSARILRWPLLAASVAGALLPAAPSSFAAAAFLLLLVPVISEAGAREALAGTEALVFPQPSVPRSPALWKNASVALFVLAAAAPLLLRASLSPARFFALVTGLLFVAAFAASAALVTGGGKLFSGLTLALWYAAVSGLPAADFCGVFGGGLSLSVRCGYLLAGAGFLGTALLVERRRQVSGR